MLGTHRYSVSLLPKIYAHRGTVVLPENEGLSDSPGSQVSLKGSAIRTLVVRSTQETLIVTPLPLLISQLLALLSGFLPAPRTGASELFLCS